jgi:hypothetical protein
VRATCRDCPVEDGIFSIFQNNLRRSLRVNPREKAGGSYRRDGFQSRIRGVQAVEDDVCFCLALSDNLDDLVPAAPTARGVRQLLNERITELRNAGMINSIFSVTRLSETNEWEEIEIPTYTEEPETLVQPEKPDTATPSVPDSPPPKTMMPSPGAPLPETMRPSPGGPPPETIIPSPDGPPETMMPSPDGPPPETMIPSPDSPPPKTMMPSLAKPPPKDMEGMGPGPGNATGRTVPNFGSGLSVWHKEAGPGRGTGIGNRGGSFSGINNTTGVGSVQRSPHNQPPTKFPTQAPMVSPTSSPNQPPTKLPTHAPKVSPTSPPSESPKDIKTDFPTWQPTLTLLPDTDFPETRPPTTMPTNELKPAPRRRRGFRNPGEKRDLLRR